MQTPVTRRHFLKTVALSSTALTAAPLISGKLGADGDDLFETDPIASKPDLTLLSDRPINMETPPHLLDDAVTPAGRLFVRNNGTLPFYEDLDTENWTLTIDGEVERPLTLSVQDLKSNFDVITRQMVLECGGNGRRFFMPGASGNQWTFGAVGCPSWTGVRLKDVLEAAGIKETAVYTGHYSADTHLSGDPDKQPISRGIPISKALDEHSMLVFGMNGADLPKMHGYPLRLVIPGWPGSCSQKWLTRIQIRPDIHDGPKMGGKSYRMPAYPVAPGTSVPDEDMVIIEKMPVKSLITFPETGSQAKIGGPLVVRGQAWSGEGDIARVDLSLDHGMTWQQADLEKPANPYAWQRFSAALSAPKMPGYYEVWARATDSAGKTQPAMPPGWNPKGYLNNMQHRVAVFLM